MTTSNPTSTWTGMVPVDDTALAVTDTRGSGRPVVYMNGSYASQRHWRPVIAELGTTDLRHITYDERASSSARPRRRRRHGEDRWRPFDTVTNISSH